jgi:hypothetical protein
MEGKNSDSQVTLEPDVMILKNIFAEKFSGNIGVFTQITENLILVFEKCPFFRRKLARIAENFDPNIDPW